MLPISITSVLAYTRSVCNYCRPSVPTFKFFLNNIIMALPINLDQYAHYVTLDDSELRELRVAEGVLQRLHRLRGLYAYWLQFPSKLDNDLVLYDTCWRN